MSKHIRSVVALTGLLVIALSGCSKLVTDYGTSKGLTARTSLNGFAALRQSYQQAGFRNRDVSRLSERVMRTDVIVWTPQVLGPVDSKVTRWFERWLRRGNHTLVYIVPDSGSEADYWIDAAKIAPPEQRLEYRKRAAKSINERMMWRLNRDQVPSNGWFRIEPLVNRNPVGKIDGPWKENLAEKTDQGTDISVEYVVVAYDSDSQQAATVKPGATMTGPTGPNSPGWSMPLDTAPTRTQIRYSDLVRTQTGDPIVAEIQSRHWKDSRVIVVAGGSLLTNYAFSRDWNRRLAEQIIAESTPANKDDLLAGFMTSDWQQIAVSERKPGVPKASGMELLTVWPMSLVTMHGVMLGLVICLMLFPIFGRPRKIERSKTNDFGHHLDAVAALMNKSGGESYARARISEYMKRMHGETSGPWVLPDPPSRNVTKPLPSLQSKRLMSSQASNPSARNADLPTDSSQDEAGLDHSAPIVESTAGEQNEESDNHEENR